MKYALVILEASARDKASKAAVGNNISQVLEATKGTQQVQILNEGALLFPLEHGLHALSYCISDAKGRGLRSRTLFFDQEPSWVIS